MQLYPLGWFEPPSRSFSLVAGGGASSGHAAAAGLAREGATDEDSLPPDFDEMVHVDGKQVIWSSGHGDAQRIYKSYRQVLFAKQALLARFVGVGNSEEGRSLGVTGDSRVGDHQPSRGNFGGNPIGLFGDGMEASATGASNANSGGRGDGGMQDDRCLCVLQGLECVKIYAPDGAEFEVALPCKALRMWALPRGILIERAVPDNEETGGSKTRLPQRRRKKDAVSDQTPMFFTLLHPLEELKPVSFTKNETDEGDVGTEKDDEEERATKPKTVKEPAEKKDAKFGGDFMCDPRERILMVDTELCFVVTFHSGFGYHSVWRLLPAAAVEIPKRNEPAPGRKKKSALLELEESKAIQLDSDSDSSWELSESDSESDFELDGDAVIEAEVYMDRIWNGKHDSIHQAADKVFIAHDVDEHPLICLIHKSKRTMKVLRVLFETENSSLQSSSPGSKNLLSTPLPIIVKAMPRQKLVVDEAFETKLLDAQPILATGPSHALDMIILTTNGSLELHRGAKKLCNLEVATEKIPPYKMGLGTPATSRKKVKAHQPLGKVVELQNAVSRRVNLKFEDGRSLRVFAPVQFTSRILRPCLKGIEGAFPADLSLSFRMDVARWCDVMRSSSDPVLIEVKNLLAEKEGLSRTGDKVDMEWVAFLIAVAELLSSANPQDRKRRRLSPRQADDQHNGSDLFKSLLQTDYHRNFERMNRGLFPFAPVDSVLSEDAPESHSWYLKLFLDSEHSCFCQTPCQIFIEHARVFVLCLHLVYEDCKLNLLNMPLLRPMAGFLTGLVEAILKRNDARFYTDHYRRDLGTVDAVSLPKLAESQLMEMSTWRTPPDVYSWLLQRAKKASTVYRYRVGHENTSMLRSAAMEGLSSMQGNVEASAPLSAEAASFRPFPELMSCFRTQQMCCFFDLLSGGTGDDATVSPLEFRVARESRNTLPRSNSPVLSAITSMDNSLDHWMQEHGYEAQNTSERAVLGMVWFAFALQDLQTLPFGIAVPLREALHFCRSSPSGRWPADAYVLVGREDMAALAMAPPPPSCPNFILRESKKSSASEQGAAPPPRVRVFMKQANSLSTPERPASIGSSSSLPSGKRQHRKDPRGNAGSPWSTVTTAVTPVWRRNSSGQGAASEFADDILWGGENSNKSTKAKRRSSVTFLQKHHQKKNNLSSSTRKLLSIADFARLSASASAEVGTGDAPKGIINDSLDDEVNGEGQQGSNPKSEKPSDPAGFHLLQRMTALRFGSDRRILEVSRLLRSSKPVRLLVEKGPEMSDHQLVEAQQDKLILMARRTMSLPVGRGMITLGTVRPLLTDTVDIPQIALAGKIPPNNAIVKMDFSRMSSTEELLGWPRFHNGAAAGLRLAAGRQVTPLTRTWIAYNRPETPNFTHAGFLMALGLQGHLAALTMADIYGYLSQGHDATTVAILLGVSAAKRGSMAPTLSKMLCLHIPSLLPPVFSDMEIPPHVQNAALMGIGLLYQKTAHRLMTEFLLAEIGRRPTTDGEMDRESYCLSAGLALGFVTLGFGAKPGGLSGLSDLRLEDRLHRYMVGGLDPEYSSNNADNDPSKSSRVKEGPYVNINATSPGATLALGFIYMKSGNESVAARLAIPDTHFLLDYVRPDLLMLRIISRSLVLWSSVEPTESWLLGQIPSAIRFSFERLGGLGSTSSAVKAARRAQIIENAENSVMENVVDDEDETYELLNSGGEDNGGDLTPHLPPPPLAGQPSTPSGGPSTPRNSSTATSRRSRAHSTDAVGSRPRISRPMRRMRRRVNSVSSVRSRDGSVDGSGKPLRGTGAPVDETAVRQAHANIVAGACFSIGLRFVGTGLSSAKQLLTKYVRHFAEMRTCEVESPKGRQRPDRSTLEMCLGTAAIAVALVMAGSGDLETLRLLRSLRFLVGEAVRFGNHMAIGSAIGILFLGGGRMSFSDDNASIAALVTSFYPRFPLHTYDNQYHLQALRHLYVLAAEERCIDAFDIDSRSPCFLPIQVKLRANALQFAASGGAPKGNGRQPSFDATQETTVDMVTPCLLPPFSWISNIKVNSPRYWPMELNFDGENNLAQRIAISAYRILCVKRKVGHLSYMEDPQGVSSLLARPRLKSMRGKSTEGEASDLTSQSMREFTSDPHVLAFAKSFCVKREGASEEEELFVEFCTASLYDCLTHEKPEMLDLLVDLYQATNNFTQGSDSFAIRNLLLLEAFYSSEAEREALKDSEPESRPLVDYMFLTSLLEKFNEKLAPLSSLLKHYLETQEFPCDSSIRKAGLLPADSQLVKEADLAVMFAILLHLNQVPDIVFISSTKLASVLGDKKALLSFAAQNPSIPPRTVIRLHKDIANH